MTTTQRSARLTGLAYLGLAISGVVGFLLMIALRSTGWVPAAAVDHAKQVQDLLLAAGMFGLGSGVRVRELARTGVRPLLLGLASWVLVAAVAYIGVRLTV